LQRREPSSPPGPFAGSPPAGANNRKREGKKGSKKGSRNAIAETGVQLTSKAGVRQIVDGRD
jgi:hypothetical protein